MFSERISDYREKLATDIAAHKKELRRALRITAGLLILAVVCPFASNAIKVAHDAQEAYWAQLNADYQESAKCRGVSTEKISGIVKKDAVTYTPAINPDNTGSHILKSGTRVTLNGLEYYPPFGGYTEYGSGKLFSTDTDGRIWSDAVQGNPTTTIPHSLYNLDPDTARLAILRENLSRAAMICLNSKSSGSSAN